MFMFSKLSMNPTNFDAFLYLQRFLLGFVWPRELVDLDGLQTFIQRDAWGFNINHGR